MILWRTALKNFWRTAAMSIMTILQTTATLVITAVMVSALSIAFHYYTPFQDYFEGNGLFVIFGYPGANSDGNTLQSDEELMAQLDGSAESIIACHHPIVNQVRCISYDDDVIRRYQPYLSAGRWLDPDADELEVVVSENDNGWKVGDLIEVEMASKDGGVFTAQTARVVGILEEGARAVGSTEYHYRGFTNYLDFFGSYSFEVEEEPLLLFSYSALERIPSSPMQTLCYASMIRYADDVDEEMQKQEAIKLANMGAVSTVDLRKMDKDSKSYLYQKVYDLLPIIIVLLILVGISCISSSALSTKQRLRDYAICYIVGLQWKQCVIVNLLQSLLNSVVSLVLAVASLLVVQYSPLSELFRIEWNGWLAAAFAGIFVLQIVASMLIPIQMLGHTTAKEVLTSGKE